MKAAALGRLGTSPSLRTMIAFQIAVAGQMRRDYRNVAMGEIRMLTTGRHDHARCVRQAIETAEEVCSRRGARLTPVRRRVLELIWNSHRAIKAYEILDRLSCEMRAARPPTVYRALEFLIAHGLAHRVDSLNAFVGCPQAARDHDAQFFICDSCGTVGEIDDDAIGRAVAASATKLGFDVERRMIELHGRCGACR